MEEGNREYKLKLIRTSPARLTHLATQLHWRLNESARGEAVYLLGVRDDGHPEGLAEPELRESIATLRRMARGVRARVLRVRVAPGVNGCVAEVLLRREESRCVFACMCVCFVLVVIWGRLSYFDLTMHTTTSMRAQARGPPGAADRGAREGGRGQVHAGGRADQGPARQWTGAGENAGQSVSAFWF